jgi:hypothetical protein
VDIEIAFEVNIEFGLVVTCEGGKNCL